jgi:uncharacterized protein YggE
MKPWTTIIGSVLGVLFGAVLVLKAQTGASPAVEVKKEKRTLSTAGSATIRVKPDSARVFFGVQTIAPTVKVAREENGRIVKKVIDALTTLRVRDLKMKTSNVSVELVQTHRTEGKLPEILGYRVTNSFTVLVKDEEPQKLSARAAQILDTALENGANIVQQISIFKEDGTEVKRQALAMAVEDAVANAKAVAGGAKVAILDTISIDGQPEYHSAGVQWAQSNTFVSGVGGGETPLIAGDLEMSCRVSVTCTY